MICNLPGHVGSREVFRYRIIYTEKGEKVEGCNSCTYGMITQAFSTEKKMIISKGTGQEYWMSPAHRRDIKLRRVAPDLSHVWKDKSGIGDKVKISDNSIRTYNGVDTRDVTIRAREKNR